ncbi:HEAT repeat domain-containing protein [Escherichia coli]|uniref:HEAT repeat domain-containing protein n=1 Tax=Escherichia coli TaxID=562 RepID=UPI001DC129EB|nr:HEAT repeat domain-containing protein [Escherichia coli]
MSMPPAVANTFLFEMMKSKSKDITLAAIYALGEGRCQADNIIRELERLSQSDDMEIKIAAIKALGRIYR